MITNIFTSEFWYIAPMIVTCTVSITGIITNWIKIKKSWIKQLISWIVSIAMSSCTWGIGLVEFEKPSIIGILILGIVTGLCSNGIYDIPTIKSWINSITNQE